MRRMRCAIMVCSLAACGGGDSTADALTSAPDAAPGDASPSDGAPAPSCASDRGAWRSIVDGLSRACAADDDCVLLGGARPRPCDCYPAIGDCGGEAVNAAAYSASGAAAYEDHFHAAACESTGPCDCTANFARCVDGGCMAVLPMCGCLAPQSCP